MFASNIKGRRRWATGDPVWLPDEVLCPLRSNELCPPVDHTSGDFSFFLYDVFLRDETVDYLKRCVAYCSGVTRDGASVLVRYVGDYRPYFYISVPAKHYESGIDGLDVDMPRALRWAQSQRLLLQDDGVSVHSWSIEMKLPVSGFRGNYKIPYVLARFPTLQDYYRGKEKLEALHPPPTRKQVDEGYYGDGVLLGETRSPESMRFCTILGIHASSWVTLPLGAYRPEPSMGKFPEVHRKAADNPPWYCPRDTTGSAEPYQKAMYIWATSEIRDASSENGDIPPAVFDSVDLESFESTILSICHVIRSGNVGERCTKIVYTWGGDVEFHPDDDQPDEGDCGLRVALFPDEKSMLRGWAIAWSSRGWSSDIVIGHNILGFDLAHIANRMEELGIGKEYMIFGRVPEYASSIKNSNNTTSARGFQQIDNLITPGRTYMDTLLLFKKLPTYKDRGGYGLSNISKVMLKYDKMDVHWTEIHPLFRGTPRERGVLLRYNLRDCELVLRLYDEMNFHVSNVFSSRTGECPMAMLCTRGAQIPVYGGYMRVAHERGYVTVQEHYSPVVDANIKEERLTKNPHVDFDASVGKTTPRPTNPAAAFSSPSFGMSSSSSGAKVKSRNSEDLRDFEPRNVASIHNIITARVEGLDVEVVVDPGLPKVVPKPLRNTGVNRLRTGGEGDLSLSQDEQKKKSKAKKAFPTTPYKAGYPTHWREASNALDASYSGGLVYTPWMGLYKRLILLDFVAMYPSIMERYGLDSCNLVTDARFAALPGVKYVDFVLSDTVRFRFAQNEGVMVAHTVKCVHSRKLTQSVMRMHGERLEQYRKRAVEVLMRSEAIRAKHPDILKMEAKKVLPVIESLDREQFEIDVLASLRNADADFSTVVNRMSDLLQKIEIPSAAKALEILIAGCGLDPSRGYASASTGDEFDRAAKAASRVILDQPQTLGRSIPVGSAERILLERLRYILAYEKELSSPNAERCENMSHYDAVAFLAKTMRLCEFGYTCSNAKQTQEKGISNATYGASAVGGHVVFPLVGATGLYSGQVSRHIGMMSCIPVAACVTFAGRVCIQRATTQVLSTYPTAQVVYGDTDSILVDPPPVHQTDKELFDFSAELEKCVNSIFRLPLKMETEYVSSVAVFVQAKTYATLSKAKIDAPAKTTIKGFEFVKSDCCPFIGETCLTAMDMFLRDPNLDRTKKYALDRATMLVEGRVPLEELQISMKLSKESYTDVDGGVDAATTPAKLHVSINSMPNDRKRPSEGYPGGDGKNAISKLGTSTSPITPPVASIPNPKSTWRMKSKPAAPSAPAKSKTFNLMKFVQTITPKPSTPPTPLGISPSTTTTMLTTPLATPNTSRSALTMSTPKLNGGVDHPVKEPTIAYHALLAKRMERRDPGHGPKSGEKVTFVHVIPRSGSSEMTVDKIEDVGYVKQNPGKCKIDLVWYMDHLASGLSKVFMAVDKDPVGFLSGVKSIAAQKCSGMSNLSIFQRQPTSLS